MLDRSSRRQVEALVEEKQAVFLEQVEKLAMVLGAGVEQIHVNQVELNERLTKVEESLGIERPEHPEEGQGSEGGVPA